MTLDTLLARIIPVLERVQVPYMLTGSIASSVHGNPRSTRDLDIVFASSMEQLREMVSQFQALDCFADSVQAATALTRRSQFNVIDNVTGWKVDFIFAEDSEYGRTSLGRREEIRIGDKAVQVISAEDIVIAKLRWAKMSGSDRQLEDAVGVLSAQVDQLDLSYLERWVQSLQLGEQWVKVKELNDSAP